MYDLQEASYKGDRIYKRPVTQGLGTSRPPKRISQVRRIIRGRAAEVTAEAIHVKSQFRGPMVGDQLAQRIFSGELSRCFFLVRVPS